MPSSNTPKHPEDESHIPGTLANTPHTAGKPQHIAEDVQSDIERLYGRGFYAAYLKDALHGRPTPLQTVHNLVQLALRQPDLHKRAEARKALLGLILKNGIEVSDRSDIHSLIAKFRDLAIFPIQNLDTSNIHLGVRPDRRDKNREILEQRDVAVNPQLFSFSTEKGAARGKFTWRGEGLVERHYGEA